MAKHTQTIRRLLPTNCLSVFNRFVGFALKGLKLTAATMQLQQMNSSTDLNVMRHFPVLSQKNPQKSRLFHHNFPKYQENIKKSRPHFLNHDKLKKIMTGGRHPAREHCKPGVCSLPMYAKFSEKLTLLKCMRRRSNM